MAGSPQMQNLTKQEQNTLLQENYKSCKLLDEVDWHQGQECALYQHLEQKCRILGQILEIAHRPFNSDDQPVLEEKRQNIARLNHLISQLQPN